MGTYVNELGEIHIPEEKRVDFILEAKQVAFQGGIFSRSFTHIKGKDIILLSFPSFEKGKYADFTYSYFENAPWENAGIQLADGFPYSEKIGWSQFNQVVQALYILAELYSTSPYISYNDSANRPEETIQWLRYLLRRNLHYQWRCDVWNIYELYAESKELKQLDSEIDTEFLEEVLPANYDGVGLLNAVFVSYGTDLMIGSRSNNVAEEKVEDPAQRVFTIDDFVRMLKMRINEYKEHSKESKEEQIQFLLNFLTCDPNERDVNKCEEQYKGLLIAVIFTTPQIIVKTISEIYHENFWTLWDRVKDSITLDAPNYLDKQKEETNEKQISTEKFLGISADDRLYWWTDTGDVHISPKVQKWLEQLHAKFLELCVEVEEKTTDVYMDRLVDLIAGNPRVLFFEELFYEFLSNFHKVEYRAALQLLEDAPKSDEEYKRLIAVFANRGLRKLYFEF